MPQDLSSTHIDPAQLQEIIGHVSHILRHVGFTGPQSSDSFKRHVQFQRQVSLPAGLLDVTVQKNLPDQPDWHSATVEFRHLSGHSVLHIQQHDIKQIIIRLSSSKNPTVPMANYQQVDMQIQLIHPISHQHEDFVYQARITSNPSPKISVGVEWLNPQMLISTSDALSISIQLRQLIQAHVPSVLPATPMG